MEERYNKLAGMLKRLGRVAVAFSGGVDSSFLLAAATRELGDNAVGITIDSPALPRSELEDAINIAALTGSGHIIIDSPDIEEAVRMNPADRCYHCKKTEFGQVLDKARELGIEYVLDGSNADDTADYRPGMAAVQELKVLSPLLELGFTKKEIREQSQRLGLFTWDKPAYACLYSRIPYGSEIKQEDLLKIELSEKYLMKNGFRVSRVRCHGDIARIEVEPALVPLIMAEPLRSEVVRTLKSYGFRYVTIDIEGYRMGSLNEALNM
ncbi:MAG: ATP-dependent sacrificial sulfur transferase LarE [Bacteroidetes bacterium]|nr:ATP-dependent sacrificial sulfur transferase LarE [Bacteroidota bacterium]